MSDRITFKCADCGAPVTIDNANPPNDDDIISCRSCGREFGAFGRVKATMLEAAKAEVTKMTERITGQRPTWTKR